MFPSYSLAYGSLVPRDDKHYNRYVVYEIVIIIQPRVCHADEGGIYTRL